MEVLNLMELLSMINSKKEKKPSQKICQNFPSCSDIIYIDIKYSSFYWWQVQHYIEFIFSDKALTNSW